MASQAEIDTAAAKAKQNNNNQAAKDTAKAKSRQNGGDGGTAAGFSAREAAAGLTLAGNNTTSGRGEIGPTFSQREANAGLTLAGNDTTAGRDDFYSKPSKPKSPWASLDSGEMLAGSPMDFKSDVPSGLPPTPESEGLYVLVNEVTLVDGVPTGEIAWSKTEEC